MGIATISFKRPRPTVNGFYVPEGSDIPVMRPRKKRTATDKHLVTLLEDALSNLARSSCAFHGCEGPSRPRPMCTCVKCYAMREIATVRATLLARIEDTKFPLFRK